MHAIGEGKLMWDSEKCELCFQCEDVCPLDCIGFKDGKEFQFEDERCWRCGRCTRVCPEGSIVMEGASEENFMRSLVEAAKAVLGTFKPGKVLYVNFLTEIQPECDCMPGADVPIIQDQGILVSQDLAAVEQASADMLGKAPPLPQSVASDHGIEAGANVLLELNRRDFDIQLREAEAQGLGSRKYELVEI
jgi:uncharacterized Fe-S center protein